MLTEKEILFLDFYLTSISLSFLRVLLIILQNAGFVTALEYSDMRKMVFRISTGSTELEYVEDDHIFLDSLSKHSETLVTETLSSNNFQFRIFTANFLEVCGY